jgi:hypothetical protein
MITNNSLNAQRMLAMMLQVSCPCTPTALPFDTPLDVTPTSLVDEAKCRRIQYYLSIFGALVDKIANYAGAGAAITSATLTELVIAAAASGGLVGGEVGTVVGPPGIVVGAIIGCIGAIVAALGSTYLFTLSNEWHQAPLYDQLLAALFAADSAESGTAAFYEVINASEVLDLLFKPLLNALWWNGWSNDIYSGVPTVDDSAFSGSVCNPVVCAENISTTSGDGQLQANWNDTDLSPFLAPDGGGTIALDVRIATYDITVISAPSTVHCVIFGGTSGFVDTFAPTHVAASAGHIWLYVWCESAFTVQVCATPV